jgi:hypothetical protein
VANDLSPILGDRSYFINKQFFKKTIYENNGIPDVLRYPQYGKIKEYITVKMEKIIRNFLALKR